MQQLEILPKLLIYYRKKKYSVNKEVFSHSLHSQHNYYIDFNSTIIITNEIFSSMQCSHHWNCYLFKTVIHSCSYLSYWFGLSGARTFSMLSWIKYANLQKGATTLHYDVQAGALQTVKLLIKYRVDVNVSDNADRYHFRSSQYFPGTY